jgi:hypothetical protein
MLQVPKCVVWDIPKDLCSETELIDSQNVITLV